MMGDSVRLSSALNRKIEDQIARRRWIEKHQRLLAEADRLETARLRQEANAEVIHLADEVEAKRRQLAELDDAIRDRTMSARIFRAVCAKYGVSKREFVSHRRSDYIVRPRHVAMFLARELTTLSLPQIGRLIGGRDHTTVLNGCRRIKALIESDPETARIIAELRAELEGAE